MWLCLECMFGYWLFENWWWVGLGKSGGRKIDVGVLYGVELGSDYSGKIDCIWYVGWYVGCVGRKWYFCEVMCCLWCVDVVWWISVIGWKFGVDYCWLGCWFMW